MYRSEERLSRVFGAFSMITIVLASLGLFGLASFTTEQRAKEIGVRKVLGATVTDILGLLSKSYLVLVLPGFIIALPFAFYLTGKWLNHFAVKINIGAGITGLAGSILLLVAVAAVGYQSIKAALTNPVDTIRKD
jgi:putative ABC transport system permease protein